MSSIIEVYNYDIFISYVQKDNKHDGWVTEIVDKDGIKDSPLLIKKVNPLFVNMQRNLELIT